MAHKPHNAETRDSIIPELSLISSRIAAMERAARAAGVKFADTNQGQREIGLYAAVDSVFMPADDVTGDREVSYSRLIDIAAYAVQWAREERKT